MGLDAGVLASSLTKKAYFRSASSVCYNRFLCVLKPTRSNKDWEHGIFQGPIMVSVTTVNIFMN